MRLPSFQSCKQHQSYKQQDPPFMNRPAHRRSYLTPSPPSVR
jgi:hypothetical protein